MRPETEKLVAGILAAARLLLKDQVKVDGAGKEETEQGSESTEPRFAPTVSGPFWLQTGGSA